MLHAAAGPTSMLIRFIGSLRQRLGNSLMSAFDARTLLVTQPFGSLPSLLFVERVRRNTLTGGDKKSKKARYSPTSLVECPSPGHAHPPGHSSKRRTLVFGDQRLFLWARSSWLAGPRTIETARSLGTPKRWTFLWGQSDKLRYIPECPLLALSGHSTCPAQCLLLGVKRTFLTRP